MKQEKQIEKMAKDLQKSEHWCFNEHSVDFEIDRKKTAENLYNAGYRRQDEVIKEFVKKFESYIGNCTFTMGQYNDIQYALKKATEDIIGDE